MDLACARARFLRLFGGNAPLWVIAVVPVAFVETVHQIATTGVDNDYWWHVTTGRWMLAHGRIPFNDPFSATHYGQNWYAHEWLAELLFGIVDRIAGYAGNIIVTAAIVAAGAWCITRAARYYGANALVGFVLLIGAGFYIRGFLAVRPQVWGWAIFALLLHELAADDNGHRARLWHIPLIFALWINIHLSALWGGGVYALYVLHRFLLWLLAKREPTLWQKTRHAFLVGAVSALALCLNPRGPALIWFARTYLNPHAERTRYIVEYFPPEFSGDNRLLYSAGIILLLLTIFAMALRLRLWPGLLALIFGLAARSEIRYVPMFGLVAVLVAGWLVGRFRGRTVSLCAIAVSGRARVLEVGLLISGTLLSLAYGGSAQFQRVPDAYLGGYPVNAAAWVKANVPAGTVFNEYGWGGYLIYAFYPQPRVYMDGREEMYGERYFKRFVADDDAEPGWQQDLRQAGVTAAIVSPGSAIANAMASDPGWQRAYADDVADVFVPLHTSSP